MRMLRTTCALFAWGGAVVLASVANASDSKVVPGSVCQAAFTMADGTYPYSYGYRYNGSFTNESDTIASVECPLVRDTTAAFEGSAWVVNPGPQNNSMSCCLMSNSLNSNAGGYTSCRASSSISNVPQELVFSSIASPWPYTAHVNCTMPAKLAPIGASQIKAIWWNEL